MFPTEPTYIAFGHATQDMPTTGSAQYSDAVIADYADSGGGGMVYGRAAMTANFASAQVNGSASGLTSSAAIPNLDFAFSGAISGSQFDGTFTSNTSAFSGPIGGLFAGPGAAEAAGTFEATTAPASAKFRGGFVVKKQ